MNLPTPEANPASPHYDTFSHRFQVLATGQAAYVAYVIMHHYYTAADALDSTNLPRSSML